MSEVYTQATSESLKLFTFTAGWGGGAKKEQLFGKG